MAMRFAWVSVSFIIFWSVGSRELTVIEKSQLPGAWLERPGLRIREYEAERAGKPGRAVAAHAIGNARHAHNAPPLAALRSRQDVNTGMKRKLHCHFPFGSGNGGFGGVNVEPASEIGRPGPILDVFPPRLAAQDERSPGLAY